MNLKDKNHPIQIHSFDRKNCNNTDSKGKLRVMIFAVSYTLFIINKIDIKISDYGPIHKRWKASSSFR